MKRALTLLLVLIAAAPLMAQTSDEAPPSPWFRQAKPCVLKGIDGLFSLGAGYSFAVYTWSPERAAWLDLAPYYDGDAHIIGGFAGLSTEIRGIPIVETLLEPLGADCFGAGAKYSEGETQFVIHASWHF